VPRSSYPGLREPGPIGLAAGAGWLAESGTHPIVSATRVEIGQKLCARATPTTARTAGRRSDDHLLRLTVLATNQRNGRVRASFSKDLVDRVLIRSDVPFPHPSGVDPALCAFQRGKQAHESDRP
jgi:hypothetical protein